MYNKRLEKQLFGKQPAAEFFGTVRPLSHQELDKGLLFHDSSEEDRPSYLEMPIKVEPNDISRQHQHQHSYSQVQQNQSQNDDDKEELKQYESYQMPHQDLLMYPYEKMDMIDEILMPHEEVNSMYMHEGILSTYPMEGNQSNGEKESVNAVMVVNGRVKEKRRLEQKKKDIFGLMNNLRFFMQAMQAVMNYHRLYKKQHTLKYYSTIYSMIYKESGRFQQMLKEELEEIGKNYREAESSSNSLAVNNSKPNDSNKDLVGTMIEEEQVHIKLEEHESEE